MAPAACSQYHGAVGEERAGAQVVGMLEPFRSGHGHTQGIGDRRCEAHACLTGGDLLCRAPDVPGPAVTLSDQSAGLVAFSWSVGRERPGEVEGGELDELGGEHPSAEDAVVAVEELEAGDGRTRAESVDDDVVEAAQSAGVGVALQAVADPVVAEPAEPEEPSGLDGAAGKSDATGVNGLGDAGGDEVDLTVVGDSHDLRFGEEVRAGRRGARQDRGLGSVLRIDGARESDAEAAAHTSGSPIPGFGVDQQRHPGCRPAELLGRSGQALSFHARAAREPLGNRVGGGWTPLASPATPSSHSTMS